MSTELRDLIYFDFNKAASLFSQVQGGLLKEMQQTTEALRGRKASGGLNVKVVQAQLSGDAQEKTSILESRILHHDLLTRLENWLKAQGQLLDLNVLSGQPNDQPLDFSDEGIRKALRDPSFLTVAGATIASPSARATAAGASPGQGWSAAESAAALMP